MPRRTHLRVHVLLALLALSLGAVAAWAGRDPGSAPDGAVAAAERGSPSTTTAAAAQQPETPAERTAAVAPTRYPIPADAAWTDVRVLDGTSGAPVADADVAWLCVGGGMPPWEHLRHLPPDEAERWSKDREAFARAFGSTARSDAAGRVRVPVPRDGTRLYARAPGRHGTLALQAEGLPPPGGFRLLLLPDRELRVAVRAADGTPAVGVPLRLVRDDEPERVGGSPIRYQCVRTTAPDGIACFDHLQDRCPTTPGARAVPWRVRVELPFLTDVSASFAATDPPREPLTLQLPPTGQVLARTHVDGRRPDHVDTILLFADDPQALRNENRAEWRTSEPDGWVAFRHVPLGQRFVARASLVGWVEQPFAGPVTPGEVVRVGFAEPPDLVVLTGRLVDETGAVLADARGSTRIDWQSPDGLASGGGGDELATDHAGRFRTLTNGRRDGACAEFTRLDFEVPRPDAPPLRAQLGPRSFATGAHDLGDIVMASGPVLVAGRLQGTPGSPPARLGLTVRRGVVQPDTGQFVAWDELEQLDDWRADDGRFTVFGKAPPGRCELVVRENGIERAVAPFTPGQRDLVVAIPRSLELWATVRLPDDLPHGVFATLQPAAGSDWDWRDWRTSAFPEPHERGVAALRWRHLTPGRYTLTLRLLELRAPLLTLADVEVPGPAEGDARLLGIDLRVLVQAVTVRVTTSAPFAAVLSRAWVAPPQSALAPYKTGFPVRDGIARFVLPAGPHDLFVHCDALQSVALPAVQGYATAELARWPEVEVTLSDLPPLPTGVVLHATCDRAPGSTAPRELQALELRRVDGARITLPYGPGPQVLKLLVEHNGRTRWCTVPLPLPPGGGPAAVSIPVAAPLQQCLDALAADAR